MTDESGNAMEGWVVYTSYAKANIGQACGAQHARYLYRCTRQRGHTNNHHLAHDKSHVTAPPSARHFWWHDSLSTVETNREESSMNAIEEAIEKQAAEAKQAVDRLAALRKVAERPEPAGEVAILTVRLGAPTSIVAWKDQYGEWRTTSRDASVPVRVHKSWEDLLLFYSRGDKAVIGVREVG